MNDEKSSLERFKSELDDKWIVFAGNLDFRRRYDTHTKYFVGKYSAEGQMIDVDSIESFQKILSKNPSRRKGGLRFPYDYVTQPRKFVDLLISKGIQDLFLYDDFDDLKTDEEVQKREELLYNLGLERFYPSGTYNSEEEISLFDEGIEDDDMDHSLLSLISVGQTELGKELVSEMRNRGLNVRSLTEFVMN